MDRSPQQMTPAEIVSEIGMIQNDLKVRLARVNGLAQSLYQRVRRSPPDDNTTVYMTYANAWIRFAGMANQGVLRTASASKVLRRLTAEQETPKVVERKPTPKHPAETSPMEDLISMYGEEQDSGDSGETSDDAEPSEEG